MAFGLVLQTLSLLDATHKSTQDEVFTLVAIATVECICLLGSFYRDWNKDKQKKIGRLYAFSVHWVESILCPISGSKTYTALLSAYDI